MQVMESNVVVSSTRMLEDSEEVHVLAGDDSVVDRKVIERLLKVLACKVTIVDSGLRALKFLGLEQTIPSESDDGFVGLKVDLIITDYSMPGMTGYELLKKIKESSTFREIPVVIMSSENIFPHIDRCLEDGAEDFIVKPVKLSDMKRLKDYVTTKEVRVGSQDRGYDGCNGSDGGGGMNKRKLPDTSDESLQPLISSTTSSPSSPSPLSSSLSLVDSPMRRLKMTSMD